MYRFDAYLGHPAVLSEDYAVKYTDRGKLNYTLQWSSAKLLKCYLVVLSSIIACHSFMQDLAG